MVIRTKVVEMGMAHTTPTRPVTTPLQTTTAIALTTVAAMPPVVTMMLATPPAVTVMQTLPTT